MGRQPTTAKANRPRSREVTEEAIYSVAGRLFADQGYASTTLEQIAREVGVHKSTIFHYVSGKEELLATVLDRGFGGYVASLQSITEQGEDSLNRLLAATRNHLNFVFEHSTEVRIFLRDRQHLGGQAALAYLEMTERYQGLFTQLIQEGMDDGTLAQDDATLTCLFVLGCANSIMEWFHPDGRMTAEEITDRYLQLILEGMVAGVRSRGQ